MDIEYIKEALKDRVAQWRRVYGLDYTLAIRSIVRQKRRSAIGLLAIAAGVVALLLAEGFFEYNYHGMREGTIRARIGHIQAVRPGYFEAGVADPFAFMIPEDSADRALLEAFPHVKTLAPRIAFSGLISLGESTVSFIGEGVEPAKEKALSGALRLIEGADLSARDALEAMLGEGLAATLGVKVGQKVVLLSNTRTRGVNAVEVTITGIFATVSKAYDDYALRLPLNTAQSLIKTEGVHTWLVLLDDTSRTHRTIQRIREKVTSAELQFVPWYEHHAADMYNKTVALFSRQVLVVKLMIGIIIVLSILNTMMTNVRERTAEIGTCMALGDERRTVLRRFLAEGVVLGLSGGIVGCVLGWLAAQGVAALEIPIPPPPGMTSGYLARITITPWIVLDALGLAVVTALLAGLYPAWKASRLEIVDALRHAR